MQSTSVAVLTTPTSAGKAVRVSYLVRLDHDAKTASIKPLRGPEYSSSPLEHIEAVRLGVENQEGSTGIPHDARWGIITPEGEVLFEDTINECTIKKKVFP